MSTRPIQEIEPKDYERLRPIVADLSAIQLNVAAILDGTSPGRVYADDVAHPRTAYLISGDGHYLAGATDNQAFNEALNAVCSSRRLIRSCGRLGPARDGSTVPRSSSICMGAVLP